MKIVELIKNKFDLEIKSVTLIGEGYDSKAYLINNQYIFKIKISANDKKGYRKEKAILEFLNKNLKTDIKIPKIDYAYITNELSIMGYKKINGKFLNPQIYNKMDEQEKQMLKLDIAKFLKDMHNLDFS